MHEYEAGSPRAQKLSGAVALGSFSGSLFQDFLGNECSTYGLGVEQASERLGRVPVLGTVVRRGDRFLTSVGPDSGFGVV